MFSYRLFFFILIFPWWLRYNTGFVKYFREFGVLNSFVLKIGNIYVLSGGFLFYVIDL